MGVECPPLDLDTDMLLSTGAEMRLRLRSVRADYLPAAFVFILSSAALNPRASFTASSLAQ